VRRARCLAETQPVGVHNLVGRNCETVALWCVCGMGESLQRQVFQTGNMAFGAGMAIYVSLLVRHKRPVPRWVWVVLAARFALLVMYYVHNRRFYLDARACDHSEPGD
jgi:hypothetical protein